MIPNVAIVATETTTGQTFQTSSNGAGQYVLPGLVNGTYDVKATSPGFKAFEAKNVALSVGARLLARTIRECCNSL